MIGILKEKGVDSATIDRFRHQGTAKEFLMDIPDQNTPGKGMCMATKSWLSQCGFGLSDVVGKTPKELIQGPLTSPSHCTMMRDFFSTYDLGYQMTQNQPTKFVLDDLIN